MVLENLWKQLSYLGQLWLPNQSSNPGTYWTSGKTHTCCLVNDQLLVGVVALHSLFLSFVPGLSRRQDVIHVKTTPSTLLTWKTSCAEHVPNVGGWRQKCQSELWKWSKRLIPCIEAAVRIRCWHPYWCCWHPDGAVDISICPFSLGTTRFRSTIQLVLWLSFLLQLLPYLLQ